MHLAFGLGISKLRLYALHDQRSLQLRDRAEYSESHLPGRCTGVHLLGIGDEFDAERLERLEGSQQVQDRTREAIELPNDNSLESATVSVNQAVKFGSPFLAPADADVHVFAGKFSAAAIGIFTELARLHRRILSAVRGADARVNRNFHGIFLTRRNAEARRQTESDPRACRLYSMTAKLKTNCRSRWMAKSDCCRGF